MKYTNRPNDKKYIKWRKNVLIRDGNKCTRCSGTQRLCAHHVIEWDKDVSLRYDITNGLTLCTSCHNKEHHIGKIGTWAGKKRSDETIAKMKSRKGIPNPKGRGRKLSEEHIEKLRSQSIGNKNMLGKKHSEETKKKMSIAKIGKPIWTKGIKWTLERRIQASKDRKGRKMGPRPQWWKDKIAKANTGKEMMPETKEKLRIQRLGKKRIKDPLTGKLKWSEPLI